MSDDQLLVIDVLRSSMNDGPGIRTTVFVKGCPLRCAWCHNPESQAPGVELSFDTAKCTLCGHCVESCPNRVHRIAEGMHSVNRGLCAACGRCVQACEAGGLKLVGTYWSPAAVVEMALRDKPYYDRSGGGLTISGGEPMAQFRPVLETLRLAQRAGIHTCLDTCGQAPLDRYMDILPYVNLFLWDVKATGEALHRQLTGVDGKMIRENLEALYSAGAKIRLRCPMVPGVNDSKEHLKEIARMSTHMARLDGIDIMPYHSFGRNKAKKVGMKQEGLPQDSTNQEQIDRWLHSLAEMGCERASVG